MVKKDEYITCSCYGEGLRLSYDEEDKMLYLSLWKPRSWGSTAWSHRFRHIWRILRTGEPWADQIVLHDDQLAELKDYVNRLPQ